MDQSKRDLIADMGYEDAVVFDNPDFDSAIIGVTESGQVVYDYELMIESLADEMDCDPEEAMEFIEYNTLRALQYMNVENPPIVMHKVP